MRHLEIAKEIVKKLVDAGYTAYFAGGWVRDFVMGHPSHDVDIATDAPPQKIMDLFPRTLLVGIQFGVIIVLIEGHQFEVSTFRSDISYSDGRRPDRVVMASPKEDALRRDFTINGMFYDPLTEVIHDFVGGYDDIQRGVICTIGDPAERFREDRLRMIRAVRFACRFGFQIDADTQQAVWENADTLFPAVAKERVWQELQKMRKSEQFDWAISEMHRLGLLPVIFPALVDVHLNDIRQCVTPFSLFPEEAPTILFLVQLFPSASQEECMEIGRDLRMPKREMKWIEAYFATKAMIQRDPKTVSLQQWTHFYAQPHHEMCLDIVTILQPEEERTLFCAGHRERKKRLENHVERVIHHNPIVTSRDLREAGIVPGVGMGRLLKEAERIVIENDYQYKGDVLPLLLQTSLWEEAEKEAT